MADLFESFGEIAFSSRTGAAFMSVADDYRASLPPVIQSAATNTIWSHWGDNNLLPLEFADDINNCGVLAAALDLKARIATGKGLQPFLLHDVVNGTEMLDWVDDSEIHDWLERNEAFEFALESAYDKFAYGWSAGSYLLNGGQDKIYSVARHDVYKTRLEKIDKGSRLIENIYLCADWKVSGSQYDSNKQVRIQLLEERNELQDLKDRLKAKNKSREYAFINRSLRNGNHYYPMPEYRSGRAWIKLVRSVPAFKNAIFKHMIMLNNIVIIHPKFWEDRFGEANWNKWKNDPEKRKGLQEEYYLKLDKWITGEDQAMKSLFTSGFYHPVSGVFTPYVEVKKVEDHLKDGKFLPDSGAGNSEILFALSMNPSTLGAGNPGGKAYGDTSGGSNVRESGLTQIMWSEAERRLNSSVMNVVKHFNGWSAKLEIAKTSVSGTGLITKHENRVKQPRLVFRQPTGVLTTLDTGKSTKEQAA